MSDKTHITTSPFVTNLLRDLLPKESLKKSVKKPEVFLADENSTNPDDLEYLDKADSKQSPLVKNLLNVLNGGDREAVERLAFTNDPAQSNQFQGLWKSKLRLIPDIILKRIAIQDDLVASIIQARSSHLSVFGRPPKDRFSPGFMLEPKPGVLDAMGEDHEKKAELQKRIDAVSERFITCGSTRGFSDHQKMTFSQFLSTSVRNVLTVGRLATEVIWTTDQAQERVFHSFRPIDAGTIYRRATKDDQAAEQVRAQALQLLKEIKESNKKTDPKLYAKDDDFVWVQVVEGTAKQVFTADECVVWNFYPVTDIELDGYPLTPIDTMIAAVTTHINITTHNKLYFQNGRATKGMVIIKSDDIDESVVGRLKQHFNASINNVSNSWRMPVFGINKDSDVVWQPIDAQGQRDMEFQYLSDNNARVIMSAFQISPEELPGYAHLSRGTNNQALSESNNEYKLEAARDVGLRPLVAQFEDFVNACLLPLFDAELAKLVRMKFYGLDADTAEKESTRLQQDMGVHYTMDELLAQVEKKPVGAAWGGTIPFNQQWQVLLDKYLPVGHIVEHFFGIEGASKDPNLQYYRDPFWFNMQQMQDQRKQMEQQAQMAQQQAAQGQPPSGGDGGKGGGEQPAQGSGGDQQQGGDLSRSVDQLMDTLSKNEALLPPGKRRLLQQQARATEYLLKGFESDMKDAIKDISEIAEQHLPEPKKDE